MNIEDIVKKLNTADKEHEVVVELETTYDGNPITISNCKIIGVHWEGYKMVIDAEDPQS